MNRPRKTATDYLLIAVCQVLIALLVGSLGFFLIEITYQGPYNGRLLFIMAMFVMGIVGIARISIEEGTEHAILYSVLLGAVSFIAIMRFVEFRGSWATVTPIINVGILTLIWWAAHKLTRDCAFIESGKDVAGHGLMEDMGLDEAVAATSLEGQQPAALAVTDQQDPLDDAPGWWRGWMRRKNRPHSPGIWIVYFSIAALPLFGLGQTLIPEGDEDSRHYAFRLLLLYVASGLALLMMTSFLGLRRYLRHRQLSMPMGMSGIWIGVGLLMIGGLMLIAMLLPRPGEPGMIQEAVSWLTSSDDMSTSEYGMGKDGNKDGDGAGDGSGDGEGDGPSDGTGGDQAGNQLADDGTPLPGSSGDGSGQDGDGNTDGGDEQGDGAGGTGEGQQPGESEDGSGGDGGSEMDPDWSFQLPDELAARMPDIVRILGWIAIAAIILFVLWRHGKRLWDSLLLLLARLARLFGFSWRPRTRQQLEADSKAAPPLPPRPFSDYANPFTSGRVGQLSSTELVYYSYHALEAWARDAGVGRDENETPIEFTELLLGRRTDLSLTVRQLGLLYSRANYASGSLPDSCRDQVKDFWLDLPSLAVLEGEGELAVSG